MADKRYSAISINDHLLLSDLLVPVLSEHNTKLVASFDRVDPALTFITVHRPILVIIDWMLPTLHQQTGSLLGMRQTYHPIQAIRAVHPDCKILVLMGERHPHNLLLAFQAGAHGVASNLGRLPDLTMVVKRVLTGEVKVMSRGLQRELDSYLTDPVVTLSDAEIRMLELVQQGLTNAKVGQQLHLSRHTVKNTLNEINQKLGTRNRIEAYQRAEEMGLIGWRW